MEPWQEIYKLFLVYYGALAGDIQVVLSLLAALARDIQVVFSLLWSLGRRYTSCS